MASVNKREMADLLNASLPTLDELIRRYPGFPIIARGSNGVPWEFDPEAVIAFLRAAKAAEAAEEAQRADLLAQFRIPGLDDQAEPGAQVAKPTDVLNTVRAQRVAHDLAKEAGQLVWRTEVRQQLGAALSGMNRFIHDLPAQMGRRFNLAPDVVAHMQRMIADQQEEFRRTLGDNLPPGPSRDAP